MGTLTSTSFDNAIKLLWAAWNQMLKLEPCRKRYKTRIRLLYFVYLQSMFSLQNLIASLQNLITSQDFIFLIFSKMNYLVQLDEERVSDARNQIHRKNDANCAVSFWVSCPSLTASSTQFPKSTLSSLSLRHILSRYNLTAL